MYSKAERRVGALAGVLPPGVMREALKGIEKESLRVDSAGFIAQTPHPATLGSALTNPYVTTDYSEALLEFITPPFTDVGETLAFLADLHAFVYARLDEEMLWATSMPCRVHGDESVPVARYGCSNRGRMKHVYRLGLGRRYGRVMQTIAGVHFNYSFPQAFFDALASLEGERTGGPALASRAYFALIRNFQRFGWLVPYLFGTSPAVCRSFIGGRGGGGFEEFDRGTLYRPHATSLRMSDIGYKNKTQAGLEIDYGDLDGYVRSLSHAISTPYPEYQALGVKVDGEWRQLNANILQIENEFYSFIRPKQIAESGERPTLALQRRGVRYVEVRALDVAAFDPVGVNEPQLHFIETLLLFCLLQDSPPVTAAERETINRNQAAVASAGRDPALALHIAGRERPLREWAAELCEVMQGCAELLDAAGGNTHGDALARQREVIAHPELLPSQRVLDEMRANGETFFDFALRMSERHKACFLANGGDPARIAEFERVASASLTEQEEIERADEINFDEYLTRYFAQ